MEEKHSTSLSGKYVMGVLVAVVLGLGAYVVSDQPTRATKGKRNVAEFLNPNQHLARLTHADRVRLRENMLARQCYSGTVIDQNSESCGAFNDWPNGDPSFNDDPLMNMIPRQTRVNVDVVCNEATGQFQTRVYFPNVCPLTRDSRPTGDCGESYFQNPYTQNRDTPFSTTPDNWLTSPGLFNHNDVTNLTRRNVPGDDSDFNILATTDLNSYDYSSNLGAGSQAGAELHIVSSAKEWEGAAMTNTLWLQGDYAIHGACEGYTEDLRCEFSGRPASKGCIRLEPNNARALYNLVRRVGTRHIRYQFHGYGRPLARLGGRPACSLSQDEWNRHRAGQPVLAETEAQVEARQQTARRESRQSYNWFQRAWRGIGNFFRGNSRNQGGSAQ